MNEKMVVTEEMTQSSKNVSTLVFTGRIYNHKKIREKFPDALLVSVMRKPWRYATRDIVTLKELGPPGKLLSYAHDHVDAEGQDLVNLQAYYTAEYFKHLNGNGDAKRELSGLEHLMDTHEKVVLLCHEYSGEFCHRHLLRYFVVDDWDYMNGGEIVT